MKMRFRPIIGLNLIFACNTLQTIKKDAKFILGLASSLKIKIWGDLKIKVLYNVW